MAPRTPRPWTTAVLLGPLLFGMRSPVSAEPPVGITGSPVRLEHGMPPAPATVPRTSTADLPFAAAPSLSPDALVSEVLARNPMLAQMRAAQEAAAARPAQVRSLEDPMFTFWTAPSSVGRNDVDWAYRIEATQKFVLPCKRALRAEQAHAEADAAAEEVEDARVQLTETARGALADYFLAERALAVTAEALTILRDSRADAEVRYKTGQVTQQDVLQADVEIGRQRERQIVLERSRQVVIGRINGLLHRPTESPLPSAPTEFTAPEPTAAFAALLALAVERRPDLRAMVNRLTADQAAVALAHKEFQPDVEVMAAYDNFWQAGQRSFTAQVGARVNLPVRCARRYAAIEEAEARLRQRQAEIDRLRDQIAIEVQEAKARADESERVIQLYQDQILPAARASVKTARSAYANGKVPFLSLLEAQRNLIMLQDRLNETLADRFRRYAALDRATGAVAAPNSAAGEYPSVRSGRLPNGPRSNRSGDP